MLLWLLCYDSDNDNVTFIIVDQPSYGTIQGLTVSGVGHAVAAYTSNTGYYGSDTFTFEVYNGSYYSNTATVTITINNITIPQGQEFVGNMISKYHQILTEE